MRKLVFVSFLFVCSTLPSFVHAADGGSQNGLLDLATTTEDLAPGGEIDDDGGTGFVKVDGGSVAGTAPTPNIQAPTTPIEHGCEYLLADDVTLNGVALIALCAGVALLLSRRRRVV